MKAKSQLIELSLCFVCALAPVALLTLNANPVAAPANELARADRESIQGKVGAKSDSSLTVDGKVIALTAGTTYMKSGKPITAADVQNGDNVKVMASKGTDNSLTAVSVEVLTKE